MAMQLTVKSLIDNKTRTLLYLSSLCSLFFLQTFCTTVCPFIDGLQPEQLLKNLFLIFIAHTLIREGLYHYFGRAKSQRSLPRQAYLLSVTSWVLAAVAAFGLHSYLYPNFPIASHLRIFLSYIILGAAILAQIEYVLFEKRFKSLSPSNQYTVFNERIAGRVIETFLIFTLSPILALLLIITRYTANGEIEAHVTNEVVYIGLLMTLSALLLAFVFGRVLKQDTNVIISNIAEIKAGEYERTTTINRPDELGKISYALKEMSSTIRDGIQEIENLNGEMINTQKEIIYTMGEIAESRSRETGNHVRRVAEYSRLLAKAVGLSDEQAERLKLASPMHDIGKVGIPDSILNKPGKLTEDEFEIMKTHAQLGYEMLKHSNKPILQAAAIVSAEHHEKYDGSGYPRGIKGDAIHIYARITAVADVFDALGSDRVYKKAWPDDKIFELLRAQNGKHFDPKIVAAFFDNLTPILAIRDRYSDPLSEQTAKKLA